MRLVYNKIIPFEGFTAINLFGIVFVRLNSDGSRPYISERTRNHEAIHTAQIQELGYVFFYLIYFFEWLYRVIFHSVAYKRVSFEIEALLHAGDQTYLSGRKHFAMWRKQN
ncbi:MAG: hypothetical protein LUD50_03155 [Clostridia bacterium]|nr:hypothetical protein [Clostridia bacterium]